MVHVQGIAQSVALSNMHGHREYLSRSAGGFIAVLVATVRVADNLRGPIAGKDNSALFMLYIVNVIFYI